MGSYVQLPRCVRKTWYPCSYPPPLTDHPLSPESTSGTVEREYEGDDGGGRMILDIWEYRLWMAVVLRKIHVRVHVLSTQENMLSGSSLRLSILLMRTAKMQSLWNSLCLSSCACSLQATPHPRSLKIYLTFPHHLPFKLPVKSVVSGHHNQILEHHPVASSPDSCFL